MLKEVVVVMIMMLMVIMVVMVIMVMVMMVMAMMVMMMIVGGLKKTSKEEVEGGGRQDKKPRKTSAVKFLWTSCHILDIPRSSEM